MPEFAATLLPHYRIDGVLTTLGPLRIGDGRDCPGRIPVEGKKGEPVPVQTVFCNQAGCAYLPASSLRGFLRSYFRTRLTGPGLESAIFGFQGERSESPGERAEALGGALTIWDAPVGRVPDDQNVADPYWSRTRATCVASHVVVERRKRTAAEELLFYEEYVPRGVSFQVTLLVEGPDWGGHTPAEMTGAILALLKDLEGSAARLGASHATGWGHLKWQQTAVRAVTPNALDAWLRHPGTPLVDHYEALDAASVPTVKPGTLRQARTPYLRIDVDLRMPGPFLVNDTARAKAQDEHGTDKYNHAAMRTNSEGPLLPASSAHGALRSQAERIARTLAGERAKEWVHDPAGKCGPKPATVNETADLRKLDAVSCLFGAPGWRAPLHVSDFTLANSSKATLGVQEFVAIDRFTGGGADALKFNAEAFTAPGADGFVLRGTLRLDLAVLSKLMEERAAQEPYQSAAALDDVLELLAFTLRDLREGDISFGFGRSKGYGACTADVRVNLPADLDEIDPALGPILRAIFPAEPARSTV